MTGSFTMVVSKITAIQKGVMIVAGLMIIIMGLAMSGLIPFGRIFGDYYSPTGVITKGFKKMSNSDSMLAYLPLGLLLGLLPCGPVYTALVSVARTGMEITSPTPERRISNVLFNTSLGTFINFSLSIIRSP